MINDRHFFNFLFLCWGAGFACLMFILWPVSNYLVFAGCFALWHVVSLIAFRKMLFELMVDKE